MLLVLVIDLLPAIFSILSINNVYFYSALFANHSISLLNVSSICCNDHNFGFGFSMPNHSYFCMGENVSDCPPCLSIIKEDSSAISRGTFR